MPFTKKDTGKDKLSSAFKEMKKNPPKILAKTKKKKGAKQANKQRVAIAFSKAKQAKEKDKKQITKQDVLDRMKKRSMME